jgi:hypothetical protein
MRMHLVGFRMLAKECFLGRHHRIVPLDIMLAEQLEP